MFDILLDVVCEGMIVVMGQVVEVGRLVRCCVVVVDSAGEL